MLIFSFLGCKPEADITYTVTFNANYEGANPAIGNQTFTAGTTQFLKTAATLDFSRTGYTFAGWATSPTATNATYPDGASYTATSDVTLYAVWRPKALSSISVTTAPAKVLYFAGTGESLNTAGMVVTATYDDGSTATVTQFTTSGFDSASGGIKSLTVSYTEGGVTKTTTTPYCVAASDALTQTVVSNGTRTINGTAYQLVKFGDFPQTIAASGITYSASPVYNGWYLGSDGYFYEACQANPYIDNYSSRTCTDGKVLQTGSTYYFKVQPIEWRVLTADYNSTGRKLILAEKILTADVPYYYSDSGARSIDGTTVHPNNYKYSQIRAYLNGLNYYDNSNEAVTTYNNKGFLQKAFTASARELILATSVDNSARSTNADANLWNSGNNEYACDNTSDKIFLLSEQEATRGSYGFGSSSSSGAGNERIRVTTDYAKANYAYQYTTSGYGGYWWLRSPGFDSSSDARSVMHDGYAVCSCYVYYSSFGVCPALSISF